MNLVAQERIGASTAQTWTITRLRAQLYEVTFASGVRLDAEDTKKIVQSIQHRGGAHTARVLVNISGLSNVCPSVAEVLSTKARPTRLAFLGESLVDEVISGFTLAELDETINARYFTDREDALEYLSQH
ncbi:hypothetical protein [Glutamicibacter sp. NPDC087344]|uniref:DUF7793 family protein n=1 Tax=Glutamicibacter sp. NPDC087344 TaxID=3363994 RepID=UPI00382A2DD0